MKSAYSQSILEAGASGVVLSRKCAKMKLTNMEGAEAALQEFGAL